MLSSQPKEHFIKFLEFYKKMEKKKHKMSKLKKNRPIIWEHMLPQVLEKYFQTKLKLKLMNNQNI
jgi:hypothetical protein